MLNTNQFTYYKDQTSLIAEASDIGWPDDYFIVESAHTGRPAAFRWLEDVITTHCDEQELQARVYIPVEVELARTGLRVIVYND